MTVLILKSPQLKLNSVGNPKIRAVKIITESEFHEINLQSAHSKDCFCQKWFLIRICKETIFNIGVYQGVGGVFYNEFFRDEIESARCTGLDFEAV